MIKNLNSLAKEIHDNAVDHGFWDKTQQTGTLLMLIVSELGEALEADRKNKFATNIKEIKTDDVNFVDKFKENIKDTFEDELADTIIRILDMCDAYEIDIEKHIELKMAYNKKREKLHGKKY